MGPIKINENLLNPSVTTASDTEALREFKTEQTDRSLSSIAADVGATTISTNIAVGALETAAAMPALPPVVKGAIDLVRKATPVGNTISALATALPGDGWKGFSDNYGFGMFRPDAASLPQDAQALHDYFEKAAVPTGERGSLASRAASGPHLDWMVQNRMSKLAAEDRLSYDGTTGTVASIGGMLFDPISLAATVGVGGLLKGGVLGAYKLTQAANTAQKIISPAMRHTLGVLEAAGTNIALGDLEHQQPMRRRVFLMPV